MLKIWVIRMPKSSWVCFSTNFSNNLSSVVRPPDRLGLMESFVCFVTVIIQLLFLPLVTTLLSFSLLSFLFFSPCYKYTCKRSIKLGHTTFCCLQNSRTFQIFTRFWRKWRARSNLSKFVSCSCGFGGRHVCGGKLFFTEQFILREKTVVKN